MAEVNVETLESIFRMITPADVLGAQKISAATKAEASNVEILLKNLYSEGAGGVLTGDAFVQQLDTLLQGVTSANKDEAEKLRRTIHIFKTGVQSRELGDSYKVAIDLNGVDVKNNVTFEEILGKDTRLPSTKQMSVTMNNSAFLSPQVRNSEKVEMFMNFMPGIVVSRMMPLLEVEFAFSSPVKTNSENAPHQWSPGIMKFLLGADHSLENDSATKMIIDATEVHNPADNKLHAIAGMEMFTSPQTLANPVPNLASAGRYADVLDPFRPLMSIESFTVDVTPTVGLYSYKKATLVFKLHDRSRMAELGDMIRPQVYQDSDSAPTVWVTYGWRHPAEPGNPYADFINGNMLVRDAYGIINSQFSFDDLGQVTITLSLWTKGVTELRTVKITDHEGGFKDTFNKIRTISDRISRYRNALGIGAAEGINREIRSFMLIESAERGTFPDLSNDEIRKSLEAIKKSLSEPGLKLDKEAVNGLIEELNRFYQPSSDKKNLQFKENIKNNATNATKRAFDEVINGIDPFLPTAESDKQKAAENNQKPSPLTSIVAALNAYYSEDNVKAMKGQTTVATVPFRKKATSFGKLFTVFMGRAYSTMDTVDEMQILFHQFNDRAGACAGTNIASFPIDMPVFMDQYREHIERKGSEQLTLEEFLKLVIDAQISDDRAIGYGFKSFFAPYDPANKYDAKLKTGSEQAYENAISGIGAQRGPFVRPQLELYVETVYAAKTGVDKDLLHRFESNAPQVGTANGGSANNYTRIMRIHVYDKTNNPYRLATTILRGDTQQDPAFVEIPNDHIMQVFADKSKAAGLLISQLGDLITLDGQVKRTPTSQGGTPESRGGKLPINGITNRQIKDFVSRMIPTIVYGGNASSVKSATLASKQDPLLATTQMQAISKKSGKPSVLQPNGAGVGGLPLRVIPASLSMTTLGCPLLLYGQFYFIDFNTGTTLDNMYGLTGIQHSITPGKFESSMTLTFYDAYGKFEAAPTVTDYVKRMQLPE